MIDAIIILGLAMSRQSHNRLVDWLRHYAEDPGNGLVPEVTFWVSTPTRMAEGQNVRR